MKKTMYIEPNVKMVDLCEEALLAATITESNDDAPSGPIDFGAKELLDDEDEVRTTSVWDD